MNAPDISERTDTVITHEQNKVTIKEYFRDLMAAQERYWAAKSEASEKLTASELTAIAMATKLAREVVDHRLETLNSYRQMMVDREKDFVTRMEQAACRSACESELGDLHDWKTALEAVRGEQKVKASRAEVYVGWLIAIIGIVISIAAFLHR